MVKITLQIAGMACGMCESHINDAIRKAFPVKKVASSHKKGRTVILSETPLEDRVLERTIGQTGYQVLSVRTEVYEKKGLFGR